MINTIGWIGSLLLALCGAPEAYLSYRRNKSDVPWSLIIPWGLGEILVFIYTASKLGFDPLLINYSLNLFFIAIISASKFSLFSRRS
jgi:hypothetical protein